MTYLLTARAKARQGLSKNTDFTTNMPINGPPKKIDPQPNSQNL